ncbi:DUF3613 domain-containing protein [Halomonas aquamarina]|uniref:DUF3613 domain-containing protein n=1 Tax=Vreelandella aquamarina TaxID=77097 RepID=A0ACC5VRZ8_9GAMM|nr:DUF3613 domain-containing protein [Halomonas aquamarina]MBZ5487046.1 DUF3613 domain-containing protein [Halomonas aquamarina]
MREYRLIGLMALGALLAGGMAGCAQPAGQPGEAAQSRMLGKGSTSADAWLQVQREGSQASPHEQRLSAAEQERASQRWLDSFTHPIPDFFKREDADSFGQE